MKQNLLIIASCALFVGCGSEDSKESVPEQKVMPAPLSLNGLQPLKLNSNADSCDVQKAFVSWFIETYAPSYSVEFTSCIFPLSSESVLPPEFDSIKPKCTGASWCSYLTARFELKDKDKKFNLAISLSRSEEKLSGSAVTASEDSFQMFFPGKPESESFYNYTVENAGSRELPLMFVTYDKAIKEGVFAL
jgi:hypothetical protein